jgi:hypothetical protein
MPSQDAATTIVGDGPSTDGGSEPHTDPQLPVPGVAR